MIKNVNCLCLINLKSNKKDPIKCKINFHNIINFKISIIVNNINNFNNNNIINNISKMIWKIRIWINSNKVEGILIKNHIIKIRCITNNKIWWAVEEGLDITEWILNTWINIIIIHNNLIPTTIIQINKILKIVINSSHINKWKIIITLYQTDSFNQKEISNKIDLIKCNLLFILLKY